MIWLPIFSSVLGHEPQHTLPGDSIPAYSDCPLHTRGYMNSLFLAQKSNQNTWFSAPLDTSLVFRWFSAFSPTLRTVVYKKTKLSCFGGFFSLVF
jgi:hypothetical protein